MLTIAHKSCTSQNSFNLAFVVVLPSYRLHFCIIPKNLAWSQNYKCKKVLITLILSIAIIDMHLDIQAMTLQDNRVNINSCSIQLRKKSFAISSIEISLQQVYLLPFLLITMPITELV